MPQSDWAVVTFFAIRSGNTTSVEIIARYDSTTSAYQLWWDSITVQNLNLINKVTYKKFVNVHRVFPGSLGGTTSIGFVTVPKSETKVKQKCILKQLERLLILMLMVGLLELSLVEM